MLNSVSSISNTRINQQSFGTGCIQIPNFELRYESHINFRDKLLDTVKKLGGRLTTTTCVPNGSISKYIGDSLEHEKNIAEVISNKYFVKTVVTDDPDTITEQMGQALGLPKNLVRATTEEVRQFCDQFFTPMIEKFASERGLTKQKSSNDLLNLSKN
ncbi:MAG: hypothetical protein WCY19_01900 [Candidatus Gastranaerophilaceae bacterium]